MILRLLPLLACIFSAPLQAQSLSLDMGGGSLSGNLIQLLLLMTVIGLAPSILIMVTSFTRIIVVLTFLRNAIGMQQSPPSTVLISLALFLTAFVMAPTLERSYNEGVAPYMEERLDFEPAFEKTTAPLKEFMAIHTRSDDLAVFMNVAKDEQPSEPAQMSLKILVPAFIISELRKAFEIGFLIFIPFIIIDLVVASILMSMGMMMLPPMMVSLPFKVIFFVMIDGWQLITGSLLQSFGLG